MKSDVATDGPTRGRELYISEQLALMATACSSWSEAFKKNPQAFGLTLIRERFENISQLHREVEGELEAYLASERIRGRK